jgi:pimeloyl-ACP methyl ester carboxylesterase
VQTTPLTVTSRDGTTIVYDRIGSGPTVILVAGAMYAQPYAVEREIEDIEALVAAAGGSVCLYGHSSGAALALEAAVRLANKVEKLAMYEAPYNDHPVARKAWGQYIKHLYEALAAGRRDDAVVLFMQYVGMTAAQIEEMRQSPFWPMAPTLAYDHAAIMGKDASVPIDRAARVTVPTLVMYGDASYPFMRVTADTLGKAIPHAQLRSLEGQTHEVKSDVLAPLLVDFFGT